MDVFDYLFSGLLDGFGGSSWITVFMVIFLMIIVVLVLGYRNLYAFSFIGMLFLFLGLYGVVALPGWALIVVFGVMAWVASYVLFYMFEQITNR